MSRKKPATKKVRPDAIARATQTGDWSSLTKAAARETRINTARVEARGTYASQRPTGPSPAPSATGSTRNT